LGVEMMIRGTAKYALVRKGAPGARECVKLGWKTPLVIMGLCTLVLMAVGIPLTIITYWLITGSSGAFVFLDIANALYTTLLLGFGGSLLTTVFALPLVI